MGAKTIGSALAQRRLELSLEKGQAAKQIGMSRTTYSSYEQDAQRPSTEVFSALAGFLGISVEQFLPLYGATCVAQARVSLGRVAPQAEQSSESSNEPPGPLDQNAPKAETPSSSETEPTAAETPPEPAGLDSEETIEPEIALEAEEVENTTKLSVSDESAPTEAPAPDTPSSRASSFDRNLSWPTSSSKDAAQKKKKKKKKGKKG